jgi:hypothetical protein
MLKTELRLSLRGLDMFIFAICMPIVVLVILGVIFVSLLPGIIAYIQTKRDPESI